MQLTARNWVEFFIGKFLNTYNVALKRRNRAGKMPHSSP